jgi:1,4-alpha-glucan branching enzyme
VGMQELIRALNREAKSRRALWERDTEPAGFQWLEADDWERSIYGFLRWSADGRQVVACLANFTPVARNDYRVGLPWGGEWRIVLDTNATFFGGNGHGGTHAVWAADGEPHQGQRASAFLTLPPLAVVWLGADAPG